MQAFDAVVDVHEGARLFAVAPDFDFATVAAHRNFAADRSRCFFLAAVVSSEWTVDVVEADDAGLEAVVIVVVAAELFGEQLLPAITGLGIGGHCVFFTQRCDVGIHLLALGVHASRGGEQETLHAVLLGGFEHVRVDEDVVAADVGVIGGDVADAAHVGSEVVDLVDAAAGRQQALVVFAQIRISNSSAAACFVLRLLDVDSAHPVAVLLQTTHQMMTDEATRSSYQDSFLRTHFRVPLRW